MKHNQRDHPKIILNLLEKNLGVHKEVASAVGKIRENPELLEALLGELDTAIYKFNRLKNESIIKNAEKLIGILGQTDLPDSRVVLDDITKNSSKNKRRKADLFGEMDKFQFFEDKTTEVKLMGRILVALYRTYMLQNQKGIREQGAQVASALEEMLALMAIEGFETHLFHAIKHWIANWKREGFSRELAEKIAKL